MAVGFVEMQRAEEKYATLPSNVDGAVKFASLNNKFRTERNVYMYSLCLLVLLYVDALHHPTIVESLLLIWSNMFVSRMVLRLRSVLTENAELKNQITVSMRTPSPTVQTPDRPKAD
jgi:hypothetical protein